MQVDALAIDGAFRFTPKLFGDERGAFSEQFKAPIVREAIGHDFELAQVREERHARPFEVGGILDRLVFLDGLLASGLSHGLARSPSLRCHRRA